MRILLIEDNQEIAQSLKEQLCKWFVVEVALTGTTGEDLALLSAYDLHIIDIALPDKNGIAVCRSLRENGVKTPILILTGQLAIQSKVTALNSGADDYLTKPFSFEELLARIRALLRRSPETLTSHILKIGDLSLDLHNKVVKRGENSIYLRRKELYLLEYLMRNSGRVITRNMILNHVWDSRCDTIANVVDVHIKHLREKIDQPYGRKMITTIHGLGYRLDP